MTRRERLEAKLERREEWAEKATASSQAHHDAARRILDVIPPGQAKERIAEVQARQKRQEAAEAAPGGVIINEYAELNWCSVIFAEQPDRSILDALRYAGYSWGSGSWVGYLDRLPATVREYAQA